jgi:hypothetical protein
LRGESTVTSLEIGVQIYEGDAPLYLFKAEGRIGFFFQDQRLQGLACSLFSLVSPFRLLPSF